MAQVLGAIIASALVYNQWKELILAAEAKLIAEGAAVFASTQFTPNGPAGIFAFYLLPGQTLPRVFLNEFVNVSGRQEVSTKQQVTHLARFYPEFNPWNCNLGINGSNQLSDPSDSGSRYRLTCIVRHGFLRAFMRMLTKWIFFI